MNNRILKQNTNTINIESNIRPKLSANLNESPPQSAAEPRRKIILNKIKPVQEPKIINNKNSIKSSNRFSVDGKEEKTYIVAKAKSKPKMFKPKNKVIVNEEEEKERKNQD